MPPPPISSHALVEEARAALERLAAASPVGQVAYSVIDQLDRTWPVAPLTVGIAGSPPQRLAAFDALSGGALTGVVRGERSPTLRVRRSARDGYTAAFADGTNERSARPTRPPTEEDAAVIAARAELDAAIAAHADRERAATDAERLVPAIIRTPPPWWAFWARIRRWFVTRRKGREIVAQRDAAAAAVTEAQVAIDQATAALEHARDQARGATHRYADRIRALCLGPMGDAVKFVEIELGGGALPEDVLVVEVTSSADADGLDRLLEAQGGELFLDGEGGSPRSLGGPANAARDLGALALAGRASQIARKAIATIREAARSVDDLLEGAEADHKKRLDPLEAKRLEDPDGFIATQLDKLRPTIHASISAIMEHAQTHLGSELAKMAQTWADAIGQASSRDELKDAIARVDLEWPMYTARAGDETRLLIQGAVGGSAYDLYTELVAPLADYGLPVQHLRPPRAAPELPALDVLPSLDGASVPKLDTTSWLGALFQRFDNRRAEVLATLTARIDKIREVARAEMLDAEPKLLRTLVAHGNRTLARAVEHQRAWLDGELARENAQIERDRQALAPLVAARDAAQRDAARLMTMSAAIENGR
jgi:hypothetical protein